MKNYLYKANFLIIIYTLIAMLLNLGSMAYIKHTNDYKAFPELSDQYAVGSITSADTYDLRTILLEGLNYSTDDYLVSTEFLNVDSFAIYYTDESLFPIELIWGDIFSEKDFKSKSNTVIVNESTKKECIEENGTLYWQYGGDKFKVIGVYDDIDEFGDKTPNCFINLHASHLEPSVFSSFIFDSKDKTLDDLQVVKEYILKKYETAYFDFAQVKTAEAEAFIGSGNNFDSMFAMLLLTVLLILLNSISATYNWLSVRRKEIAVRKLVGAHTTSIVIWICNGLFFLLSISFVLGCIASKIFLELGLYLPTKESVQSMFGVQLRPEGFIYGFIFSALLCGIVAGITIWNFYKSEIARELI